MPDASKAGRSSDDTDCAESFAPVEKCAGRLDAGVLLVCDHAANTLPESYGALGLPPTDLATHIAYDIGAAWITRRLATQLAAPAVLSRFSRLLIDANRGSDDPTLVMQVSDRRLIPGNARIDCTEIDMRRRLYWQPYRDAIRETIVAMSAQGPIPAVVSIHSFTPVWRGVARPWEVGILWDSDPRLAEPLMAALTAEGLLVGDNEPYDGALHGDTLYDEVTRAGLAGLLIEVRQDLIDHIDKAEAVADRLAATLAPLLARPQPHRIEKLPSRADRV